MSDVDLECWFCLAPFDRDAIERDGFLVPRRPAEGGPYFGYECPRCHRPSRVEKNRAGALMAGPEPIVPVFDQLFSLVDKDARVELESKRDHAKKRAGRRDWFFGPHADALIAARWRPGAPAPKAEQRSRSEPRAEREAPRPRRERAPSTPPPPPEPPPPEPPPPPAPEPPAPRSPHEVLGVPAGATADEVEQAFRELTKRYHPDRFAVLDPEFQQLAERRMKELLAAREALLRP